MHDSTVLVIGGTGFIGRHLVAKLEAAGYHVRVPTRNLSQGQALLPLPHVEVIAANVHDTLTLAKLIDGADAVINLVGILHDRRGVPYGPGFAQNHVALPQQIVSTCERLGVHRLLQMSALGADPFGPSMYQRSKGDGEAAVARSTLDWTIFRPSVVFGPDDHFINLFAQLQRFAPFVPLACAHARFQPVYVGDVAQAFVDALANPATHHRRYDLGGPQILTLAELVRFAGAASGHPRPVLPLPDWVGRLQAMLFECLPGTPPITRDNLDSMSVDNVVAQPPGAELNWDPVSLHAVMGDALGHRKPR